MNYNSQKSDEKGLVTITSVIIIIIIISIITLSLAALTRRNLRQSVDEQLSTQAQYAAESGINAALAKINDPNNPLTTSVTTCDKTGSGPGAIFTNNVLGDNVRYSCVLVDANSTDITTLLAKETSKVYKLEDFGGGAITNLTITWSGLTNPSGATCTLLNGCLTKPASWSGGLGLLRVRLIPNPITSRTNVDTKMIDITAYPFKTDPVLTNNVDLSTVDKNYVVSGNCSSSSCTITISKIPNPGKYYIQLYTYYSDSTVKITGTKSDGTAVSFSGAQVTIDSTGISQDVVKRIKAKIAIDKTSALPIFAIGVENNLCKRFTTSTGSTTDQGSTLAPDTCPAFQ